MILLITGWPVASASLLPLFEDLQNSVLGQTIRNSPSLIALIEIIHLIGLTLLLGTVLMVDLTLLGRGIGQYSASELARSLKGWTVAGLVLLLASGPMILCAEAVRCYRTPAFWIKMILLVLAITFHFGVYGKTVLAPSVHPNARAVAIVSLSLWTGVALAGKAIGIFAGS